MTFHLVTGVQSVLTTEGTFCGYRNEPLTATANEILDKSQILPPDGYGSLRSVITSNENNSRLDKKDRTWTDDKNRKGECDSSFSDSHNTGNQRSSSIITNTSHQYNSSKRKTEESEGLFKAGMHDLWSINPKNEDRKEMTPLEKLDKLCSDNTDSKSILPSKPPKELPRSDANLKHSRTEKKIPEIVSDHSIREESFDGHFECKTISKVLNKQERAITVCDYNRREKKEFQGKIQNRIDSTASGSFLKSRPTRGTSPGEVSRIRPHSSSETCKVIVELVELLKGMSGVIPEELGRTSKRAVRELYDVYEANQERLKSELGSIHNRFWSAGIEVENKPTEDRKGAGTVYDMPHKVIENECLKSVHFHNPCYPSVAGHAASRPECPSTNLTTSNERRLASSSKSGTPAYQEILSTSRTTAYQDIPSTSGTTAYQEIPSTSGTTAYQEIPSTSGTTAYQEIPSTSGSTAYQEIPSTSKTPAYQEITSKSSTYQGTIESPASLEGAERGSPYPSQHDNPFDIHFLPPPQSRPHLLNCCTEFISCNDYPSKPSPDSSDLSDENSDFLGFSEDDLSLSPDLSSTGSTSRVGEDDLSEITRSHTSGIVTAKLVGKKDANLNRDLESSAPTPSPYQSCSSVIVKPSTSENKDPIGKTSSDRVESRGKVDDFPTKVTKIATSDRRTTGQMDEVIKERNIDNYNEVVGPTRGTSPGRRSKNVAEDEEKLSAGGDIDKPSGIDCPPDKCTLAPRVVVKRIGEDVQASPSKRTRAVSIKLEELESRKSSDFNPSRVEKRTFSIKESIFERDEGTSRMNEPNKRSKYEGVFPRRGRNENLQENQNEKHGLNFQINLGKNNSRHSSENNVDMKMKDCDAFMEKENQKLESEVTSEQETKRPTTPLAERNQKVILKRSLSFSPSYDDHKVKVRKIFSFTKTKTP